MRKLLLGALFAISTISLGQSTQVVSSYRNLVHQESYAKLPKDQLKVIADTILAYQFPSGGWPKNQRWDERHLSRRLWVERLELRTAIATTGIGSTIDNNATINEIIFLAKFYASHGGKQYRQAVIRGIEYLLNMQYDNGGFPQFWPSREPGYDGVEPYDDFITFNDNAMVLAIRIMEQVSNNQAHFKALKLDKQLRQRCRDAYYKGIQCILDCQIRKNGELTVWCQQHNHKTLLPEHARVYEHASFTAQGETCAIIQLLMSVPEPSDQLIASVSGAIHWLEKHALHDIRIQEDRDELGRKDRHMVASPGAPLLWARYYDLDNEKPFYCDRDGTKHYEYNDVDFESRNGYRWVGDSPANLIARFPEWLKSVRKE